MNENDPEGGVLLDNIFASVPVSQFHHGVKDGMVDNILSENAI